MNQRFGWIAGPMRLRIAVMIFAGMVWSCQSVAQAETVPTAAQSSDTAGPVSEEARTLDAPADLPGSEAALSEKQSPQRIPSEAVQPDMAHPAQTHADMDLSPMGMYQAADWVVKSVMILLLVASVLTWAMGVAKQLQIVTANRHARRILRTLVAADTLEAGADHTQTGKGMGMALLHAARHELVLSGHGAASDHGIKERVQARLDRVQASAGRQMNQGTGILATVGSVAPFVGLFGTVWGIMNAFIGIAETKTTNLAVVAPGIAEALLATAIGLVAAIPAVVIYNHFTRVIQGYKALLADISVAILVLISRDLDRQSSADVQTAAPQPMQKAG
ncbi:tonB-system energizer ExbB [Photobacterium sp. 1_MG-2023]|uniref:tonB-system energizer ExbB n=1 Tax=Photobacterium sp. 1_MG-2023 TaxID=3062646 RepID=UPI0026E370F8|nr:tonB-system energizer ExbB [Photobacterium sp. 1_MG-2023]MDO6707607.1 tonB-system energizer ExbB [Photobacterium sp. 1_MG-2023]